MRGFAAWLFSAVPVAVLTTLLFTVPSTTEPAKLVFFGICYLLWGIAYKNESYFTLIGAAIIAGIVIAAFLTPQLVKLTTSRLLAIWSSVAGAVLVFGLFIVIAGYHEGVHVTAGMQQTVWFSITIVPAISCLLSIVPFAFYRLGDRRSGGARQN
jgi:Na+/melibiose symporter-like transporter